MFISAWHSAVRWRCASLPKEDPLNGGEGGKIMCVMGDEMQWKYGNVDEQAQGHALLIPAPYMRPSRRTATLYQNVASSILVRLGFGILRCPLQRSRLAGASARRTAAYRVTTSKKEYFLSIDFLFAMASRGKRHSSTSRFCISFLENLLG